MRLAFSRDGVSAHVVIDDSIKTAEDIAGILQANGYEVKLFAATESGMAIRRIDSVQFDHRGCTHEPRCGTGMATK